MQNVYHFLGFLFMLNISFFWLPLSAQQPFSWVIKYAYEYQTNAYEPLTIA